MLFHSAEFNFCDNTHVHHNGTCSIIDLLLASHQDLVQSCSIQYQPFETPIIMVFWQYTLIKINQKHPKTAHSLEVQTCWLGSSMQSHWCYWLGSSVESRRYQWNLAKLANKVFGYNGQIHTKGDNIPPRRNRPWLSKKLIQAIHRKNILYKRARATNDFSKYKSCRNRVTGELRNAKKAFFSQTEPQAL